MSGPDIAEMLAGNIRLNILRVLEKDPAYSHNEYIIQAALEAVGHSVSLDRVRTELAWLDEQGLVTLSDGGVLVAKLTERGVDAALGHTLIPGVARRRPGH